MNLERLGEPFRPEREARTHLHVIEVEHIGVLQKNIRAEVPVVVP